MGLLKCNAGWVNGIETIKKLEVNAFEFDDSDLLMMASEEGEYLFIFIQQPFIK